MAALDLHLIIVLRDHPIAARLRPKRLQFGRPYEGRYPFNSSMEELIRGLAGDLALT
jgi:hypothetical protein